MGIVLHLTALGAVALAQEGGLPLELRLSLADSAILENKPVVAQVRIVNVSRAKQRIAPDLEPSRQSLRFEITGPDGKRHGDAPMAYGNDVPETQELAPKESLTYERLLFYSRDWGVHFKEPGQYQIRARFSAAPPGEPTMMLASNTVTLDVRAAEGVDLKALEHFRGNPQAIFGMGFTNDWTIQEEFETIIRKYPQSAYAPWSYYFVGRALQQAASQGRKQDSPSAMARFETLLKKYPNFPLAMEVRYQIAKEMLRQGKKQEALARLDEIIHEHPQYWLFQCARQQMHCYRTRALEIPVDALP